MPKVKNAKLWERDPHDWYPEPDWCSERLFAAERFAGPLMDPCAGTGRIVKAAQAAGYEAQGYDLVARPAFPAVRAPSPWVQTVLCQPGRTVVTNPPYKEAQVFIDTCLRAGKDVAAFLQLRFGGGERRSQWLAQTPLASVLICAPRPSCPPGAVWMAGEATGNGGEVDHAWFIWRQEHKGPPTFGWLRKEP